MDKKVLYRVFIWCYAVLYVFIGAISFLHAIEFFNIGNNIVMSTMLAAGFEIGLALSLMSILLSDENRKNTMQWVLMIVLTAVQVIGNVYSVFKHIALGNDTYYVYLQKSLLFWIQDLSQDSVMVIISWITGALLPVVALMMTDMVASNIRNLSELSAQPRTGGTDAAQAPAPRPQATAPDDVEEERMRLNGEAPSGPADDGGPRRSDWDWPMSDMRKR